MTNECFLVFTNAANVEESACITLDASSFHSGSSCFFGGSTGLHFKEKIHIVFNIYGIK